MTALLLTAFKFVAIVRGNTVSEGIGVRRGGGRFHEEIELSTDWNVPGQKGSLGYRIEDPARDVFHASANSVEVTDELRATAALLDARPDRRWHPWERR
ncbi:hypothetical protein FK529_04885 [Tsukamurella asaccharolytica]|uniref:Uncharacterized protein n=1 Tax=Tsukamurella asaccharolytica TaxID=2592067 RepID=A0A5C5RCD0_9ACTN|nr:hypothetical protein [Tsukamurella asaccharolytica]TWS20679.1 hypothetical protein FK529_04885 [Tsukamurella asaccharolytica]